VKRVERGYFHLTGLLNLGRRGDGGILHDLCGSGAIYRETVAENHELLSITQSSQRHSRVD